MPRYGRTLFVSSLSFLSKSTESYINSLRHGSMIKFPFLLFQTSMSVLRIPTHVMKTLIVPTMTVLTSVLVNWDSLEMVQFVKV